MREENINKITNYYNVRMKNIFTEAMTTVQRDPSKYVAGQIRSLKGGLVESLGKKIIKAACRELGINNWQVIGKYKLDVGITNPNYFRTLDEKVARNITSSIDRYTRELELDNALFVDGRLVLTVESKAFTEKTMFGRTVAEAAIAFKYHPNRRFIVLQLENALGGDYAEDKEVYLGSESAHIAMSDHPEIKIDICTLLDGTRNSSRPVHESKYYKEISYYKLNRTIDTVKDAIRENMRAPQRKTYQYNYSLI